MLIYISAAISYFCTTPIIESYKKLSGAGGKLPIYLHVYYSLEIICIFFIKQKLSTCTHTTSSHCSGGISIYIWIFTIISPLLDIYIDIRKDILYPSLYPKVRNIIASPPLPTCKKGEFFEIGGMYHRGGGCEINSSKLTSMNEEKNERFEKTNLREWETRSHLLIAPDGDWGGYRGLPLWLSWYCRRQLKNLSRLDFKVRGCGDIQHPTKKSSIRYWRGSYQAGWNKTEDEYMKNQIYIYIICTGVGKGIKIEQQTSFVEWS